MNSLKVLARPIALIAAVLATAPAAGATQRMVEAEAEGTAVKVTLPDGRVLYSPDLVGATIGLAIDGAVVLVRIDGVERDPEDKRPDAAAGEAVWLHDFSAQAADGSWFNPCDAGPDGRRQGFVLAGRTSADAVLAEAPRGELELVCTSGAQGKCARFGYHPWSTTPDGRPMREAYNACVRMMRGDYTGGDPRTRNGTMINLYDHLGVQEPDDDDEGMVFEAGWDADGAVCVHHPRIAENATLAELEAASPRLRGRTGAICTPEFARAHGALLFNLSHP